jgi:hypothetical protein
MRKQEAAQRFVPAHCLRQPLNSFLRGSVRVVVASLVASLYAGANAAPGVLDDACYIRNESVPVAIAESYAPSSAQSYLGLRRKATQLVEVELSVLAGNTAVCSADGVARVRGALGQEFLVLPVRPGPGTPYRRDAEPCLVYIRGTPTAIEISTTEPACRAQALCGGQVELHGQRFEFEGRIAPGGKSPCFERRAP